MKWTAENDTSKSNVWRACALVSSLLIASSITGCNRHAAIVTGMVKLDGAPLQQGSVTFHPLEHGQAGYGMLDAQGRYVLRSGNSEEIAPGRYVVTVIALEPSAPAAGPFDMPGPGKHVTPARYASATTSDLRAEVHAGKNQLDFALSNE